MGRLPKKGLNYFPKDVGFYNDFKIMDLLALHGPVGVTIYEVILTEVYQNGYYLAEPIDRVATKVVRIIGNKWVQKRLVSQVILDCGELGLFETTLLKHGVITSVGIQRRFATVTLRNKANKEKYWLIDENGQPLLNAPLNSISVAETGISVTETQVNVAEMPQKESKLNKIKLKDMRGDRKDCLEDAAYQLPLVTGDFYLVSREEVEKYRELYPAVDVDREFRKMAGWLDSHPKNRKTPRGIGKFINGWLCRAQDSARPADTGNKRQASNRFNNFEQRDTDYDSMVLDRLNERLKGEKENGGG